MKSASDHREGDGCKSGSEDCIECNFTGNTWRGDGTFKRWSFKRNSGDSVVCSTFQNPRRLSYDDRSESGLYYPV